VTTQARIVGFDPHLRQGELRLDSGEQIRFTAQACAFEPTIGLEVRVLATTRSYSGEVRATSLALADRPTPRERWVWPAPPAGQGAPPPADGSTTVDRVLDLSALALRHPEWLDAGAAQERVRPVLSSATTMRTTLRPHPLFDAWRDGVAATAALSLSLSMRVGQLAPGESCLGGERAELSCPWPTCARCQEPLSLVLTLTTAEFPALFDEGGRLHLFLCLECKPRTQRELDVEGLGLLRHEPDGAATQTQHRSLAERLRGARQPARRVEAVPHVSFPAPAAFGPRLPCAAAARLFAVELWEHGMTGAQAYQAWVAHGSAGSHLGGWPRWTGADQTPDCPVCTEPMRLDVALGADVELGLGGTVWLFSCRRTPSCAGLRRPGFVFQAE
jgi:hypothetical protein